MSKSKNRSRIISLMDSESVMTADKELETFANDVLIGLSAKQKYIPAAYHYDAAGSDLFNQITELPEYYLTKCEVDALELNKEKIAGALNGDPVNLIEFGPGDGSKTRTLVDHFLKREIDFRYVAVDVSESALDHLADDYNSSFPGLSVDCLAANFFESNGWLKDRYNQHNLVLFLGSSIGNFDPAQAKSFLDGLNQDLNDGDKVIIGFDLAKEKELITKAYNDSKNVTAEFNFNVLRRINRELGGEFDTNKFRFQGNYNENNRVMQSYLISLEDQDIYIDALNRELDIEELAENSGFSVDKHLYDSKKYFLDSVWEVRKS